MFEQDFFFHSFDHPVQSLCRACEQGIESGNVAALVALYHTLGGPDWVQRRGWRGERPNAGVSLKPRPAQLHGV